MEDSGPSVSIPRLHTARLLLREYRMGDFDAFAGNLADPEACKYTGVHDRRTAWRIFGSNCGTWLLSGAGWWALEERESGAFVGQVGAFFRESAPEMELGWLVLRAHWGRGIAAEAVAAVARYAFDERRERRLIALIDPMNVPSLRLAARLGFTYERDQDFFGKPIGRHALTAA